jgi:hypothetical protein
MVRKVSGEMIQTVAGKALQYGYTGDFGLAVNFMDLAWWVVKLK